MNTLDLIIIGVTLLMAIVGFSQGFIIGAMSLVGVVVGGLLGTRAMQFLLDGASSPYAPLVGLGVGVLITLLVLLWVQDAGIAMRRRLRMSEGIAIDRVLGSLLSAVLGLILVWFCAAITIGLPQFREVRPVVLQSHIVRSLNRMLPPAGPLLNLISSYDPFPAFDGPKITIGAPTKALLKDPEVRAASKSVVRVVGSACGWSVTGTGWVAAPGMIVTNAHVVAGESSTEIQPGGDGATHHAEVVYFDPINDIAILRVRGWNGTPLQVAKVSKSGTAGVVLGYPENGPFTATAARYSDTRKVSSEDLYGRGPIERSVTSFRGLVRHGNSGGPVVDGAGNVITTVFASTVGGSIAGGYGVPNRDVAGALGKARSGAVSTGPCIA